MAQRLIISLYHYLAPHRMRFVFALFISSLFLLANYPGQAQVGEAKERARSFKSGSGSESSSADFNSSRGASIQLFDHSEYALGEELLIRLAGEIIFLPMKALYKGQSDQLYLAHVDDWRISFEGRMLGGFDPLRNVTLIQPQIRGNWGLFSTQVRYNRIFDNTGVLSTLDWQILQFNVINHEAVRWVVGLGLSKEIEIDQTHFEGSSSLTVFLADRVWAPTIEYRFSGNGSPRQEFSAMVDYRPNNQKSIFNTFSAGFLHQNWYGVKFNMLVAGVGFKIQ